MSTRWSAHFIPIEAASIRALAFWARWDWMVVLSFPKQAALVIRRESGKLKRSRRARKEISRRRRAFEPRGWRASMQRLFPQCGRRGWNAAALWPTSKCASWPNRTSISLSDRCAVWRSGRLCLFLPHPAAGLKGFQQCTHTWLTSKFLARLCGTILSVHSPVLSLPLWSTQCDSNIIIAHKTTTFCIQS